MNKEQKELYFRSQKPSAPVKQILTIAQEREDAVKTDILLWRKEEVLDFLRDMKFIFPQDIYNAYQGIMAYADYSARKGEMIDNGITEITFEDLLSQLDFQKVRQYYTEKEEFLDKLKRMENPVDKYFLLGLYEGIQSGEKKELENVKLSDIEGDLLHLCTGRTIPISDELKGIMVESEETFVYYKPARDTKLFAMRDYVVKPVYRMGRTSPASRSFSRRLERVIEEFEDKTGLDQLTKYRIADIGRYNFVREKIRRGEYTLEQLFSWAEDGRAYLHEDIYGQVSRRTLLKHFYKMMLQQ